jgi:hypothetical protein
MNEKIKQFAEQAGLLGPGSRVGNAHEATEKFAQLIIAECLDAVHSTYSDFGSAYPEKLAAGRGGLHYGYITIQNRFGLR